MAARFLRGGQRLEDIFQDEIIPAFASTDSFKRFARSSKGLCLDQYDIQQITEDSYTVEEQKLRMLELWREKAGPKATPFKIRSVLKSFQLPESEKGYLSLSEEYSLYKNNPISKNSEVYFGVHHGRFASPREVVIKLVKFDEKNKREVESLQKLGSHTNIVMMLHHGVYESDLKTYIYIVMESCRPENLWDYLQKMRELDYLLEESQMKAVIKQFLEGLQYIHFNELIHRDIKPQNLLISKNGKFIKICDYGLTKPLRNGCSNTLQSRANPGTDGFRAPETYLKDVISKKTDVYSAGLVSYSIVSNGAHAFGDDPHLWNSNIRDNKNQSLTRIYISEEKPMRSVLEHMLQHSPKERPTIEKVLRNDLFKQATTNLHLHEIKPLKGGVGGDTTQVFAKSLNIQQIFINQQPCDGKMTHQVALEKLPGTVFYTFIITYSFPSGQLEGISYPGQEFTAYLPNDVLKALPLHDLLEKAFSAGMTFRLKVAGKRQGTIVWYDIPHKTSRSGGPENNGYPDENYLEELDQVLKAKGFSHSDLEWCS